RIFCIGRNYVAHVEELNSEMPSDPLIFMKPVSSLVPVGEAVPYPKHGRDLHQEAELVLLIGREGQDIAAADAPSYLAGLSLGIDLTLRDVQSELKAKGKPWELAKAFDASAQIGEFVPFDESMDLTDIRYQCYINGELKQDGHTAKMIFPIRTLIAALSKVWKLLPGDLIYTGTPAGVGSVQVGDTIQVSSELIGSFSWTITE
ncbi:MAG: fumarylacetoacetate hydrolase family protein, partial [Anaerolineales bacterium]|nr:fumarylacetoacetate hydrolase family protein [Anaerolineales bacterium]